MVEYNQTFLQQVLSYRVSICLNWNHSLFDFNQKSIESRILDYHSSSILTVKNTE